MSNLYVDPNGNTCTETSLSRNRRFQTLLIFTVLTILGARAEFTTIGGITYGINTTTRTAYVDGAESSIVTANIQSTITKNGVDYPVTSIASNAFGWSTTLRTVNFPSSLLRIGASSFAGCTALTSVVIPHNVTEIDAQAFNSCSALTSVTIGNAVTSIGDYAFNNCTALTTLTIGNAVKTISKYAFCGCKSLTSVTLPGNVASLGECAFKGCTSLTSLTIADSQAAISFSTDWLSGAPITRLYFGRPSVPAKMFYHNDNISYLSLGAYVKNIDTQAFDSCDCIASVTCSATTPPTCVHTLDNPQFTSAVHTSATLYVPKGTVDTYRAAHCWSSFVNIAEIGSADVDDIIADPKTIAGQRTVYNLSGELICSDATDTDIDNLPAGVYIIDKCKVLKQ